MKKMWIIILLMFVFNANAQESDITSPIFPYNTCVEPCWLGIIPDVNNSLDVDDMLENFSNIVTIGEHGKSIFRSENGKWAVDEDTGIVQSGGYTFDVLTQTSEFPTFGVASRIEIRDGRVSLIMILASEEYDVRLSDILTSMGTPDYIRMISTNDFEIIRLSLIYLDKRIVINLYQSGTLCQTDIMLDSFSLLNIFFHSEQSASKAWKSIDSTLYQPALIRYVFETERDVPPDLWEQWISGEIAESCFEAWEKLEPPDLEAIAITPTPTVEVTAEATP